MERAHAIGDATALGDVRALTPGQAYSESPSAAFGESVQKRANKVHEDAGHSSAGKEPTEKGPGVSSEHSQAPARYATSPNPSPASSAPGTVLSSTSPTTRAIACSHSGWPDLQYTADGPNWISADAVTSSRTYGSRVPSHARQPRAIPRHMIYAIFNGFAAGPTTTAPARARKPTGCTPRLLAC